MTIGSLIFLAIGTILALLYIIVLLVASPKYAVYIQNLTDKYCKKVDEKVKEKEKEIMEI